jgi:hypothetical protein
MPEIVRRVKTSGGRIVEWVGDAAYLAYYCVEAVERVGGKPFFNFKDGVDGRSRPAIKRLHDVFMADPERYRKHYNRRQGAENGNGILKKRFGHSLRARTPHAQYAECMLRCIAHNIAMLVMSVQELGINPRYWAADICKTADFGSVLPPATELERVKALLSETEDA